MCAKGLYPITALPLSTPPIRSTPGVIEIVVKRGARFALFHHPELVHQRI